MASEIPDVVFEYELYIEHRLSKKHKRWLHLFPLSGSQEFVATDILKPLKKTGHENSSRLVLNNQFTEPALAALIPKFSARHDAVSVL